MISMIVHGFCVTPLYTTQSFTRGRSGSYTTVAFRTTESKDLGTEFPIERALGSTLVTVRFDSLILKPFLSTREDDALTLSR